MAPFHLPWPTFAAFLVLGATIILTAVWAWADRVRDRKDES